MKLPTPIQVFFNAERGAGDTAPVCAFAPDAIVKDEGKTHVGPDAIQAWWRAAKAQYQHSAEPLELIEQPGLTVVRAKVTGQFPGSPAFLSFAFRLHNGRIAALEISA